MANIRERRRGGKPVYQAQVRMAGFPARTATFPNRRMAERWAKTVEAEMIEGKHFRSVEARRRTLADAIDRYTEEELPKKRADKAMHQYLLPWWRERYGRIKLADLTPAVIVEARGKLATEPYRRATPGSKRTGLSPGQQPQEWRRHASTINRYLEVLGHVCTMARREWHWMANNPMDGVSKLDEGPGRVRYLSDDERAALLKETGKDPQLHALATIALATAARVGELLTLAWSDVDLRDGRALLRKTKNAQPRVIYISGAALDLLRERAKVQRLGDDRVFPGARPGTRYSYGKPFRAAVAAAGLRNVRFHDLRHTAATTLARMGASEQQLRAIGGWKSGVVSRYVHLAGADVQDLFGALGEKVGGTVEKVDGQKAVAAEKG